MASADEIWLPLVDEPIGEIVRRLEQAEPGLVPLSGSPRRLLAFRTFAYIRVGLVLGQLLADDELEPYDRSEAWAERVLASPAHRARLAAEVRAVAAELGAAGVAGEGLGPDEPARKRFRDFARRRLRGGDGE